MRYLFYNPNNVIIIIGTLAIIGLFVQIGLKRLRAKKTIRCLADIDGVLHDFGQRGLNDIPTQHEIASFRGSMLPSVHNVRDVERYSAKSSIVVLGRKHRVFRLANELLRRLATSREAAARALRDLEISTDKAEHNLQVMFKDGKAGTTDTHQEIKERIKKNK